MYSVKIADLIIDINDKDGLLNGFFKDYIYDLDNKSDFGIEISKDNALLNAHNDICKNLYKYNGFMIHGACIEYDNNAYMFVAPSGTGKTTHIRKWQRLLEDKVRIINGDKPIVRLIGDKLMVFGNPWCGKEKYGNNTKATLKSIIILKRGEKDSIYRVNKKDYLEEIFNQIYLPDEKMPLLETMDIIDNAFNKVDMYVLECTDSDNAFITAYEELTGNKYEN